MTTLLLSPILVPLLGALLYWSVGWRAGTRWVATSSAVLVLAAAVAIAAGVTADGPLTGAGLLRADALSAYLLIVIGCVAVVATVATPAYLATELVAGRLDRAACARYSVLVQAFLAVMALAVLAANLGVLWVAIEATTVVTAFLVGQRRTRTAVEAAWKYVVISSTGIALALLGTFLLNYASLHTVSLFHPDPAGLDWVGLVGAAPALDPGVTRIAVVLLVIGFGTKAGLAPLHSWLPDAHSQAPAPVSALMSGVLISVAFYAVLRVKVIADAALGADFTRALLLVVSLASLTIAASLILGQRDYKRMLAYSSIENMGLLALGAAIGSRLAIAAVLLHVLGHGLAKSTLFLGAGRMLQLTGSSRIDGVRSLTGRAPVLAGCFGLGILAVIGFPPFSLFASEFGIARAGFAGGLGWATAAALLLALVTAGALMVHTGRMLLGGPSSGTADAPDVPMASDVPAAVPVLGTARVLATAPVPATAAPAGRSAGGAAVAVLVDPPVVVAIPVEERPGVSQTGIPRHRPGSDVWAMAGALTACAVLGIWLGPLGPLLQQAAAIVTGTP